MIPVERLFLLCITLSFVVSCDATNMTKREGKHLLALLGYLHGYRLGHDVALQLSPYVLSPIIIVPSTNQQQSFNIQAASNDENYQESGGTVQVIAPAKVVSQPYLTTCTNGNKLNDTNNEENGKNVSSNAINIVTDKNNLKNVTASPRQVDVEPPDANTTAMRNSTTVTQTISITNTSVNSSDKNDTTLNATGPYPNALYDKDVENITITNVVITNQELPPINDNRWQNFSVTTNQSNFMMDDNITMTNEPDKLTMLPVQNVTESSQEKGPYPNAWYNKEAIDQLSLTTNYNTNESPSPGDGWGSYSPMNSLPSGFKPLAGLYYDGYLHKPLKKYEFTPQSYWKYYG